MKNFLSLSIIQGFLNVFFRRSEIAQYARTVLKDIAKIAEIELLSETSKKGATSAHSNSVLTEKVQ
jgi:hypothetical protein